jgi:hypothetical protein
MSSLSPLARFLKDVRSQQHISRGEFEDALRIHIQEVEHGDTSHTSRQELLIVAERLSLTKKQKAQFFSLLNKELPRRRNKRYKFDSKRARRIRYGGRFS